MVNNEIKLLALGIITCARQEVTLLSNELLHTHMVCLKLSSFIMYSCYNTRASNHNRDVLDTFLDLV